MNIQENLRALAAADTPPAPFGFDEFVQRRALAVVRRRTNLLSAAGSIATLGVVSIMALVTQAPQQPQVGETLSVQVVSAPQSADLPALVKLDQFDVTTDLEDHIALLDAELSAARVQAAPVQQLRQMESTRQQLNQSLQRVTYAHSLLNL
ncbi:MAG: hypothetical protein ABIQ86_09335 [Steroidobacteraceae bacterium]